MTRRETAARAGLPRSYLRCCVLLLLGDGPAHGYDLLERLPQLGLPKDDPGGLYRCLRAMEQEGLVHSWWEPSKLGAPRRTYVLTDEGFEWLHVWAGTLRHTYTVLGDYLSRYDRITAHGSSAPL